LHLLPYGHHLSVQSLTPSNRTKRFGNLFSRHVCFLLTAALSPTANDIWAMLKTPLAPAIPLPATFCFKVQAAFEQVGLGQRIRHFSNCLFG
jgi:hypothetical protein